MPPVLDIDDDFYLGSYPQTLGADGLLIVDWIEAGIAAEPESSKKVGY
jgi:hypothetical protein